MKIRLVQIIPLIVLFCTVTGSAAVTNYMSRQWCTNATVASNPYGNWTYAYGTNGNRQLPYIQFPQYKGVGFWDGVITNVLDIGATNMSQCVWYIDEEVGKYPAAGLDEYSFNLETGEYNPNDTCVQLFTGTNGQNTSVGWIAPTNGTVEKLYYRWKTFSYWFDPWAKQTNACSIYIDQVRDGAIIQNLYTFTNDYVHDYWGPVTTIELSTPFEVEAGDIIYTSFIQRNNDAFNTFWIFGTRWDGGNNDSYILFSAAPPAIDWCNLQWPYELIDVMALAPSDKVYGQVYIDGITPAPGPTPGLEAWLGYGATNEAPDQASWNWIPADFNPGYTGNNDEFYTNFLFSLSDTGAYAYCYRYEYVGQAYVYGQKDGPHSLATYNPAESGLMTVIVPEPCTGILCGLIILGLCRRLR